MSRAHWPVLVLVTVGFAAIAVINMYGRDADLAAKSVQIILSTIGPLMAGLYVVRHVERKVDERSDAIHEQVNGRMSEILAKVPDPAPEEPAVKPRPRSVGRHAAP